MSAYARNSVENTYFALAFNRYVFSQIAKITQQACSVSPLISKVSTATSEFMGYQEAKQMIAHLFVISDLANSISKIWKKRVVLKHEVHDNLSAPSHKHYQAHLVQFCNNLCIIVQNKLMNGLECQIVQSPGKDCIL